MCFDGARRAAGPCCRPPAGAPALRRGRSPAPPPVPPRSPAGLGWLSRARPAPRRGWRANAPAERHGRPPAAGRCASPRCRRRRVTRRPLEAACAAVEDLTSVEQGERLVLAGDGHHAGRPVEVEALRTALLGVVAAPLEGLAVHDLQRGDRVVVAAPVATLRGEDVDAGRAGVGDDEVGPVLREPQPMRVGHAAQLGARLGIRGEVGRAPEEQDAVGVVVADGEPATVPAHADAVRDVQPCGEEDLAAQHAAPVTAVHQVPRDVVGVVVADHDLVHAGRERPSLHRAGGGDAVGDALTDRRDRFDLQLPQATGGRGQGEDGSFPSAVRDDQRAIVEEAEAVRLTQAA